MSKSLAEHRETRTEELRNQWRDHYRDLENLLDTIGVTDKAKGKILGYMHKSFALAYTEAFTDWAPDDKWEQKPWGDWQAKENE